MCSLFNFSKAIARQVELILLFHGRIQILMELEKLDVDPAWLAFCASSGTRVQPVERASGSNWLERSFVLGRSSAWHREEADWGFPDLCWSCRTAKGSRWETILTFDPALSPHEAVHAAAFHRSFFIFSLGVTGCPRVRDSRSSPLLWGRFWAVPESCSWSVSSALSELLFPTALQQPHSLAP